MGLVLVSHGNMAIETLKSAELILGKIPGATACGLEVSDGPESLKAKLVAAIQQFPKTETVYVMLDLLGGTPSNVMVTLSSEFSNLQIIAGVNLPMVINYGNQVIIGQPISVPELIQAAVAGVKDVTQFLNEEQSDDDEEDC